MAEQLSSTGPWSRCILPNHIGELRRRQGELIQLLPWPVPDPRLVEALELMSAAVTDLIEDYDEVNDDDTRQHSTNWDTTIPHPI
jgi:hypothetical protein